MRLFLLSLTFLLLGATLSIADLLTPTYAESPLLAAGPPCTGIGFILALLNNRKDRRP